MLTHLLRLEQECSQCSAEMHPCAQHSQYVGNGTKSGAGRRPSWHANVHNCTRRNLKNCSRKIGLTSLLVPMGTMVHNVLQVLNSFPAANTVIASLEGLKKYNKNNVKKCEAVSRKQITMK
eukprot:27333-Amphidinium_carterae.2